MNAAAAQPRDYGLKQEAASIGRLTAALHQIEDLREHAYNAANRFRLLADRLTGAVPQPVGENGASAHPSAPPLLASFENTIQALRDTLGDIERSAARLEESI